MTMLARGRSLTDKVGRALQKETPQKRRPRSSSGASKGVAGQRQRSSSSSSNSQRERQVTLGKDDLVVEVVSIHHGKKSKVAQRPRSTPRFCEAPS